MQTIMSNETLRLKVASGRGCRSRCVIFVFSAAQFCALVFHSSAHLLTSCCILPDENLVVKNVQIKYVVFLSVEKYICGRFKISQAILARGMPEFQIDNVSAHSGVRGVPPQEVFLPDGHLQTILMKCLSRRRKCYQNIVGVMVADEVLRWNHYNSAYVHASLGQTGSDVFEDGSGT
jgi:hypothetical protein